VNSRFTRAAVYRELGRDEEALAEFQTVLELDPLHENAMQNAGYLSAMLGRDEEAREYYEQYLMLNPANTGIRMRIAYELAQAGDPLGAMQFIEVGLEVAPDDVELLKQHGGFAFTAGAEANEGQEEMPPEAQALFRKALDSYGKVYEIQGAEMDVALLRNMVAARINLGENQEAVSFGEEVLQTHGEEAAIWAIYADALKAAGQLDEGIAALEEVKSLDPEYPNIAMRQGSWLLEDGRIDEAVPFLQDAAARGEQSVDQVAYQIFANAVNEGIQKSRWDYAISTLRLAKDFDVSDLTEQEFNFFLGYAIYSKATAQSEPNTLETAKATLPQFQEVLRLMQSCGDYAQRNNRESNRQELLNAANTYIGIQEAIIKRGR
jgi:tetratricopeptide (TPR) repeat protein